MKLFFVCCFLFSSLTLANPVCHNEGLKSQGWVQGSSSSLQSVAAKFSKLIKTPDWVFDMKSNMMSQSLRKYVTFESYDNLVTSSQIMFGDFVIYKDHKTGELLEVRWFENGKKHFAHTSKIRCSVDGIPFAVNSLF